MSGLLGNLLTNTRALNAHAAGADLAGRNLANVNNPDYTRQRIILGDRGTVQTNLGAQSLGLEAIGIEQIRDILLDQQIVREIMITGSLEAQSSVLTRLQSSLGESINRQGDVSTLEGTIANNLGSAGLSESLDDFFNSFHELAASPNDAAAKQVLFQKTEILAEKFNVMEQRLITIDADIRTQANQDITEINTILDNIASLNSLIGRFEVSNPGGAVDLRDQRQSALQKLAKLTSFEVRTSPDNSSLIQIVAKDTAGNDVIILDGSKVKGTMSLNGTNVTFGQSSAALQLTGGSLYGTLKIKENVLTEVRANLDLLANQITTAVNQTYNPLGTGNDFFDAAGLTAGTFSLDASLSATSIIATNTSSSGANEIALAVAEIGVRKFSIAGGDVIDGTASKYIAGIATRVGREISAVESNLENQMLVENLLREQRNSVSGVSVDEEMTDLIRFQRAFQASARVINIINSMLEVVVSGLIR